MRKLHVLAVFFAVAGVLFGQLTSLNGVVSDPTGAVIPGATITIVNTQTGVQRETTSDAQGRYAMPQVAPGSYKLTAKTTGFADVVITDVELRVNQPSTIPVVFEKIGSTTTTIAVEAATVQVNTTDASLGNAIGGEAITQLPFFARNVVGLLAFQPGVTTDGNVNGGKSDQGNVTLDGVDVNNQNNRAAFTSVLRVTLDSIAEFRTTTANANADQGRTSGGQVALVTRTGTNVLHGALYEYRRGTETAANDYFNNLSGIKKPALLINVFGGRVGGPIKKNKAWFFFNYEGRRDASASNTTRTVPSDDLRNGIVRYRTTGGTVASLDAARIRALDPAGIGINPASRDVFNQYPRSNDSTLGDGLNFVGYRFSAPTLARQNTYISRFDWQVDNSGKHQLFWRGNLQNDWSNGLPQYPGQAPSSVSLANHKGYAVGYTTTVRSNLISTFRYGLTRYGAESTGLLTGGYVSFRGLSTIYPTTTAIVRIIPTHTLSEDLSWTKGAHQVQLGAVLRRISNGSDSTGNSFSVGSTNVSWLFGIGAEFVPPDLLASFRTAFTDAMAATMGLVTQVTGRYNYKVDGSVLPQGASVSRKYNNEEYEWYVNDTWRVRRGLTVTLGLRHSLMPPIYEANGQQTTANPSLGEWFYLRANLAKIGRPQTDAGKINFILANGPGGRDLYPNRLKNFAPRVAIAYSPQSTGGLSGFFFGGPNKTSIRAGWGMFYDLIGQPLAQTYASSALGFSSSLNNPSNILTPLTAPRFTGFYNLPTSILQPAPKGGFPQPAPEIFAITNSIDDTLKAPYSMNLNFSIGREFGRGLYVQGAYVGRLSRRSLINNDLAMPTNLVDPRSGQTYFEAAQAVVRQNLARVPNAQIGPVPFWENLFPGLASSTQTATQRMATLFAGVAPDYTGALQRIDQLCNPSCGIYGPYAMFNSQYSALSAWSSVGKGTYHSMQWTARKRFSEGLTVDFNFTYGKSLDLASSAESGGSFSGLLQNPWVRQHQWSHSSYDSTFIANGFAVWQIPVGRKRKFLGNVNRAVDALVGGWEITPTISRSSGTPVSVLNCRCWPTNWNVVPNATALGPVDTHPTKNAPAVVGTSGPNLFPDPNVALGKYTNPLPGEIGQRNVLRIQGPFTLNTGLSKRFALFTLSDNPHSLQFRWETFNLPNTARFTDLSLSLSSSGTFGKYTGTSSPRQMQFALRYEF